MARKQIDLKKWLIPRLRKLSLGWPGKAEARNRAKRKVPDGYYLNGNEKFKTLFECAKCKNLVGEKEGAMDHINPVVKVDGYTTLDDYANRLLCPPEGYQHLCAACHSDKTVIENKQRNVIKKNKKV